MVPRWGLRHRVRRSGTLRGSPQRDSPGFRALPELRKLIDEGRRRGRRTGRLLIFRSASVDLVKQAGEILAERIEFVSLNPLDVLDAAPDDAAMTSLWPSRSGTASLRASAGGFAASTRTSRRNVPSWSTPARSAIRWRSRSR